MYYYYTLILYTIAVYGPMAVMSICAGVLFSVWIFLRVFSERKEIKSDLLLYKNSPVFLPSLWLILACAFSLFWAKASGLEFMGMKPNIEWKKDIAKLWHICFPFILGPVLATLTTVQFRKIYKLWILLGVASTILGIVQHYVPIYHPLELPDVGLRGLYHSTGMTGFHLSYASIMAFPTAAWLAFFAVLYRREGLSPRTLKVLLGAVLFLAANIFTYSKIAWLSVPLTVVFLMLIGLRGRGLNGRVRNALILGILVFSFVWASSPQVRLRFKGTDTIKERIEVWSANLEMIKTFPLFGVGWHHNAELSEAYYNNKGMRGFQSHAHNNILDQWATTGLVGLIPFLWLSFALLWMSFRIYKKNHDLMIRSMGLGFLGGWFCIHINGLTQTNFWDAKVLHQIGWVTAMTMEAYRRFVAKSKK